MTYSFVPRAHILTTVVAFIKLSFLKKIIMSKYLWLVPFLGFFVGYYGISRVAVEQREVPSLLGLSLQKAMHLLATQQLAGHIVAEKEDEDLDPGTVLDQTPRAGQRMRRTQPVALVVTKRPDRLLAPICVGLTRAAVEEKLSKAPLVAEFHELESQSPRAVCIAQYPAPEAEIIQGTGMHIYISAGMSPIRLLPDFRAQLATTVVERCQELGIAVQLFHAYLVASDHVCATCRVCEQKPLAGSCINLLKPATLQLMVN